MPVTATNLRAAGWAFAGLLIATTAAADGRYDAALRFRTVRTPHFVIHYHQGEEALARRLTRIVEEEHAVLVARLGHVPRARTHVVLVDQNDESNGWSTPVAYNLIEIAAAPPDGESTLGNTDDWLRLVFRHEYAHVLHLDPARRWASAARHVFGRAFFAFPNLTLPQWQIEGLATFEESRGNQGRVPAGDFRAILGEAARAGRPDPLDRVNGGLAAWPGGMAAYVYGAYFHDYLARRFGEDKLAQLSAATSGRLPYLTAGAFRSVFGESLGTLWRAFEEESAARASSEDDAPAATRVTFHGYATEGPAFMPDGALIYSRRDVEGFPALERVPAGGGPAIRVAERYGGRHVSLRGTRVYFDQLDYAHSAGVVSDLYVLDMSALHGRVRRLTWGARLSAPAVSPDGRWIAAIETRNGHRALVVASRASVEERQARWRHPLGTEGIMAVPCFSPDSRFIALERRTVHGPSEIVVVDPDGRHVRVIASSASGRNVTPTWTPDGTSIVFASDRAGGTFQLYRTTLDRTTGTPVKTRRLTDLAGGARAPAISAGGADVAFIGSTRNGYDVFTTRLTDGEPVNDDDGAKGTAVAAGSREAPTPLRSSSYSPWSTLWPRAWLPVVETSDNELRVGAATGGTDALGYHAWSAAASWSVARDAELAPVAPGARPDVTVAYAYQRWRPTFSVQVKDETTPLLLPASSTSSAVPLALREQSLDAGVLLPFRRVRRTSWLLAAYHVEHDVASGAGDRQTLDRGALRAGAAFSTVRRYGHSISPEWGASAGIAAEVSRRGLGSDGRSDFLRGDVRAYVPGGFPHAVLALRATAARSGGDEMSRRILRLGGSDGDVSVLSFSEDASALLRGFPSNAFLGTRVALVNGEYRVPLAWIERGHGTWPLFVRSLQAAAFVDAGNAWDARAPAGGVKWSWGAEVGGSVVAGFVLPLDLMAGAAWGHDPSGTYRDARRVYVRIGYGF